MTQDNGVDGLKTITQLKYKFDSKSDNNNDNVFDWVDAVCRGDLTIDASWLGDGTTSKQIIQHLNEYFSNET